MGLTRFPRGVSSFGVPVAPALMNLPPRDGRALFVDAATGSSVNSGEDPNDAKATITQALGIARAGDSIYVFPGSYAEDVSVTLNYISIIGAIQGYGKPDLTGASTSSRALTVRAQGFVMARMRIYSGGALATANGVEATGRLVRIKGNGYHIEDCVFDGDATLAADTPSAGADNANSILVSLKGDADDDSYTASEGRIIGCLFRGASGRALALETGEPAANGVGVTDSEFIRNRFYQNVGVDVITRASVAGGGAYSSQRNLFAGNWFMGAKNKTTWMDFTTSNDGGAAAQSGSIMDNFFQDDALDGTAIAMAATGFAFVGNYDSVGVQDGSAFD